MRSASANRGLVWFAAVLTVSGGCYAPCCSQVSNDCTCTMRECDLGSALDRLCSGQCFQHHGCDPECCDEIVCTQDCGCPDECEPPSTTCPTCPLALGCRLQAYSRLCRPVEPGPPPVSYRPPMPPEFLPVPTRPIFSAVNMAAPEPMRGEVEVDYGPQLTSPGRD